MTDNEASPGSRSLRVSLMRRRRLPWNSYSVWPTNNAVTFEPRAFLGHVVLPGSVSFYSRDGKT
jgi:hypothetical protein